MNKLLKESGLSLRHPVVAFVYACSILLGLTGYLSVPVYAGVGFQPVSQDELKMTREPQAPGAPAIILYRQVDRDDTGLTAHEDNYIRIKILTEEGRKYADIEIPFYKEDGNNIVNVKARTIRPDGSIANFDGKIFEKSIAKAQGLKYVAKTFTLPDIQVGSIIEYYYTLDLSENILYNSRWILSDELFTRHAKFSLKPYTLTYDRWTVSWTWQKLPPGTPQPKEGPDHIIRLEANNIPAFRTEDYMPPENELKARVDFKYSQESFEKDPVQYWKKKGKKINSSVENFVGKGRGMEAAVAEIVSPGDSPEVKLQKIYARVQQLRNTSYEVEKTEQEKKREKEKEPVNAEELWKRGYGNGADITWLFLAMARAAGFEAYGVWASDRNRYFFSPAMMDDKKLDANLVLVKVGGKDVFCDPGSAFAPFGLLPWEETGVQGLRLDKDGGTWIQTPLPESASSRVERHADLTLSAETGELTGKLTITFTGLEGLKRRVEERHQDDAARKKYLEDQAREYIPAASEVELKNSPEWKNSSMPLVAEYDLKIPGWASGAGRRVLFPVGLFSATEKHVFEHAERVHPIYFEFPFEKLDDVAVTLPAGWQVSSLPPAENQDIKAVAYASKVENGKQTIHLTRKLRVDLMILEAKYYPTLQTFFRMVRNGDEQQIVLQPGGASASK
jgi:transglutaminase-like putative cysteine protease